MPSLRGDRLRLGRLRRSETAPPASATAGNGERLEAPPAAREHRPQIEPFHLLLAIAVAAALVLSLHPFKDPDFYWHVRLGGEIWHTHSVSSAGSGWTILPPAHHWTSPEWLSDVLFYGLVTAFSWHGALIFQFSASLVFFGVLALVLLRQASSRAAAPVFAVVIVTLAPFLQPRPQTASFIFVALLAGWCSTILHDGRLPRPALFLATTFVWAQLHGLWVLGPVFLAATALLRLLDDRSRPNVQTSMRGLAIAIAGAAVGCVNPLGLASWALPFRLAAATGSVAEWQPTSFTQYWTLGIPLCVAALVYLWSRAKTRVPAAELAWAGLLVGFSFLAFRNVPVSLILLAPTLVRRLGARVAASRTTRRERRLLAGLTAVIGAAAVASGAVASATMTPIPSDEPVALAQRLDDGQPHRVLADYNLGGLILAFGGPRVRVAVDGRADYFGATYLQRYQQLLKLDPGWRRLYQQLDPDAALLTSTVPITRYLLAHGWSRVGRHGGFSLLVRRGPGALGQPS